MLCSCGVELPVSSDSVLEASRHDWYYVGRAFNRVFYRSLKALGVEREEAQGAIALLSDHKLCMKLTARQIRGAYGLEKGVFGRHGGFLRSGSEGDELDVALMDETEGCGDLPSMGFEASDWPMIEGEGLACCRGKPDQADVADEFRWVRASLYEWPDFRSAPSKGAIKDWLTISRPGNEALLRDFVTEGWSKRLSPGDSSRSKKSAFEEDRGVVDKTAKVDRDESLLAGMRERLGEAT